VYYILYTSILRLAASAVVRLHYSGIVIDIISPLCLSLVWGHWGQEVDPIAIHID
jgi:hypothetical protein